MWDNFDFARYLRDCERNLERLDETMDRHRKPKKGPEAVGRPAPVVDAWKPEITIPRPFSMTLRESAKDRKKSRSQLQFEEERMQTLEEEKAECSRKFKANPAPAHVYVPLYRQMQEKDRAFRNNNKEFRKSELKHMERPFRFDEREKDREKLRAVEKSLAQSPDVVEASKKFRANPVPRHIFEGPGVLEKMQEDQIFREVKRKVRAEETLRKSKLPATMGENLGKFRSSKMRAASADNLDVIGRVDRNCGKPKINHKIPNFDLMYKQFQDSVAKNRAAKEKETTVCRPFKLRTGSSAKTEVCVREKPVVEQTAQFGSNLPKRRVKASNLTSDTIPPKATKSYELMRSTNEEKLKRQLRESQSREENERKKKERERDLQKAVAVKAAANDRRGLLEEKRAQKLREFREQQREMELEYQRKLAEITNRVESRDLLIERQAEVNATREAEKRYQAALRSAGINEETVTSWNRASDPDTAVGGSSYQYRDSGDIDIDRLINGGGNSYSDEEFDDEQDNE